MIVDCLMSVGSENFMPVRARELRGGKSAERGKRVRKRAIEMRLFYGRIWCGESLKQSFENLCMNRAKPVK